MRMREASIINDIGRNEDRASLSIKYSAAVSSLPPLHSDEKDTRWLGHLQVAGPNQAKLEGLFYRGSESDCGKGRRD